MHERGLSASRATNRWNIFQPELRWDERRLTPSAVRALYARKHAYFAPDRLETVLSIASGLKS